MNNLKQKEPKNKRNNGGLTLIYKLTHYNSYHDYRVRLNILRSLIWVAIILWIARGFSSSIVINMIINDTVIFLLGIYLIGTYMVTAKASVMFQDSAKVMQDIAFQGVVSRSWHLYDGIYGDSREKHYSIEISFFNERAFLTSFMDLLRKKGATMPLSKDDILNLRDYVEILSNYEGDDGETYQTYATLSDNMANELASYGIELTQIDLRYRDKPFRWDYARATGKMGNAFFGYPTHWHAYLLNYYAPKENKMDSQSSQFQENANQAAQPQNNPYTDSSNHMNGFNRKNM